MTFPSWYPSSRTRSRSRALDVLYVPGVAQTRSVWPCSGATPPSGAGRGGQPGGERRPERPGAGGTPVSPPPCPGRERGRRAAALPACHLAVPALGPAIPATGPRPRVPRQVPGQPRCLSQPPGILPQTGSALAAGAFRVVMVPRDTAQCHGVEMPTVLSPLLQGASKPPSKLVKGCWEPKGNGGDVGRRGELHRPWRRETDPLTT